MPGAVDELAMLNEHTSRYRQLTIQMLGLVPEDKLDWRPEEPLRTFAQQFVHIAQTQEFYIHGIISNDWDFGRVKPPEKVNREEIERRLKDAMEVASGKLSGLKHDDL